MYDTDDGTGVEKLKAAFMQSCRSVLTTYWDNAACLRLKYPKTGIKKEVVKNLCDSELQSKIYPLFVFWYCISGLGQVSIVVWCFFL